MKTKQLLTLILLFGIVLTLNAQEQKKGSVAYYESLRIAFQSKIDWVQSNPEEHVLAEKNKWYKMANENVQKMIEYKLLAEQSPNKIYLPQTTNEVKSITTGGGGTCAEAALFCTDLENTWPCGTDEVPGETGPDYGCLNSEPNPAWYYMQVESSGDIVMELTANQDIDFIIWGPFESMTCDYTELSAANIIDCSYSSTNIETPEIGPESSGGATTAIAGEYYVFMVTNFSNQAQDFSLIQTGGDGTTAYEIENFINLTLNIGDCEPAQTDSSLYSMYDIDGFVSFPDTLVLDSVIFTLDNMIFQTSTSNLNTPIDFSLDNQMADGVEHSIEVVLYLDNDSLSGPIQTYTLVNCAICEVNAGPDVLGNIMFTDASLDVSDFNFYWEALCADFVIIDSTDIDTEVNYIGASTDSIYCDLVWTISNYMNLTCKDTITALYIPLPSEPVFVDSTAIACFEDSVFLSVVNYPYYTYHWDLPEGWQGQSDSSSIVVYNNGTEGSVSVTAESIYGMGSPQTLDLAIMDYPIADFSYTFTETELTLTNNSQFASTYLWDFGDSTQTNENDPIHAYAENGAYFVRLYVENYCGIDSNFTNILVSGIGIEELNSEKISIYPNPTKGFINISGIPLAQNEIVVLDLTGRVVYTKYISSKVSTHIDLSGLKNGIYQLILNGEINTTIVIQK